MEECERDAWYRSIARALKRASRAYQNAERRLKSEQQKEHAAAAEEQAAAAERRRKERAERESLAAAVKEEQSQKERDMDTLLELMQAGDTLMRETGSVIPSRGPQFGSGLSGDAQNAMQAAGEVLVQQQLLQMMEGLQARPTADRCQGA